MSTSAVHQPTAFSKSSRLSSATPKTQLANWTTVYPEDAWKRIRMEGAYLTGVPILGAIVIVALLVLHFDHHPTAKPILVCALGGIAGSWIYAAKVYVAAVTGGRWKEDQVVERLTSPFEGILLSVSTYASIQTGLLGVSFTAVKDGVDSLYSAYAIGFFVGLFSVQVMGRLAGVAKTLFGSSS